MRISVKDPVSTVRGLGETHTHTPTDTHPHTRWPMLCFHVITPMATKPDYLLCIHVFFSKHSSVIALLSSLLAAHKEKDGPHLRDEQTTTLKRASKWLEYMLTFQTLWRVVQGGEQEWGTLCSRKTGATGLQIVKCFKLILWASACIFSYLSKVLSPRLQSHSVPSKT